MNLVKKIKEIFDIEEKIQVKKNIEFSKDNKTKLTLLGSSSSEISINY